MANTNVKKMADAFEEVSTWAATGRDHYDFVFRPAWEAAKKLRTANDDDPGVAGLVSKALAEMNKSSMHLRQIISNFDAACKKLLQAKVAFDKATAKAKK